jgi:hypothetical protein
MPASGLFCQVNRRYAVSGNENSTHLQSLGRAIPFLAVNLVGSSLALSLVPLQEGAPLAILAIFLSLPTLLMLIYRSLNPGPSLLPAILLYGMSGIFAIAALIVWLS